MKKGQKGPKHSLEARERHRLAALGSKHPMWGKHHTEEAKEKKRIKTKNKWDDPNSLFNTKEYREKISISNSGENNANYGIHFTEERKEKQRKSMYLHWNNPNSIYNSTTYKLNRQTMFSKNKRTKIEEILDNILNELNIEYLTQQVIHPYCVDFLLLKNNIIIEADGTFSHGDPRKYNSTDKILGGKLAKEKWAFDKNRDKILKNNGYKIIRFWEFDIIKNPEIIKEKIKNFIF